MTSAVERPDPAGAPDGSWVDHLLDLEVGAVAHGGHCVARHEGRVVFVRHALPGERVHAVVTEDGGGSYCRADAVEVRRASPDRVEAPCPWAGPGGCGGCDFQHVDPAAQRTLKATVVAEQLERLAGIVRDVVVEELPGGPLRWRTRLRLAVAGDGRPGLRAHRSHDVLPVGDCPIAVEDALTPVLERPWSPGTELDVVRDGDRAVHVDELTRARRTPVLGSGTAREHAAGRDWALAPGAFWQVHPHAPDAFAAAVLAGAGPLAAGDTVWDLYGGVGLFAAALAGAADTLPHVVLVESDPDAAAAAGENLADLPTVRVVRGRVERVLGGLARSGSAPDVVVADPPRRGLGRGLAAEIAALGPRRVVHVACDPAALARDVAAFTEHGYVLDGLRAFDAFPMTHHVECVATLVRASAAGGGAGGSGPRGATAPGSAT